MAAFRCIGWQHSVALGGRINLHWVAEWNAFSNYFCESLLLMMFVADVVDTKCGQN
jgi:hypothetical protein